jgi:phage shock protein C
MSRDTAVVEAGRRNVEGRMRNEQRLTRSRKYWIAGVCGGIAEFLGWTPGVVRTLYVFFTLVTAVIPGMVTYFILAMAMPPPDNRKRFRLEDFRAQ